MGDSTRVLPCARHRLGARRQAAIVDLFEHYVENEFPDPDTPREYVLYDVCAHIVLAQRLGLDVSFEAERLPAALLREDVPADDVELDVDVDLDAFQVTSDVGRFELERDEDDRPVIAGRIYHSGGEPVSADDVPEREAGRVLSDEWIAAALEEATWRDYYDDELVADATTAFEDGTLGRKLVVVQDRTDEYAFDESLAAADRRRYVIERRRTSALIGPFLIEPSRRHR